MAQHTPGPWRYDESAPYDGRSKGYIRESVGQEVIGRRNAGRAVCRVTGVFGDDTMRANARLIAAAPDLLDALRALLKAVAGLDAPMVTEHEAERREPALRAARAALAKAEGR